MIGVLLVALLAIAIPAHVARSAGNQISIFDDDGALLANPSGTLQSLRDLGVTMVRIDIVWADVAPDALSHREPSGFNASNPSDYPASNWKPYDNIVRDAAADGIAVDMDFEGGAPLWATGPHQPNKQPHPGWDPSPAKFGQWVHAVGERYSGHYRPSGASSSLPRVSFWAIWDEPNLGFTIAPQGVLGHLTIENSGHMYRDLLDSAWTALHQSGHGSDKIIIGELAPRGANYWGVYGSMKPLRFVRALYCVDAHYHELRGQAAAVRGCPTTAAGSARFRAQNPALFEASAFSDHLWMRWYPPNSEPENDPDYTSLPDVPRLESVLDRLQRLYGSHKRFPIYNTEFGYITDPPNNSTKYVSPATASYYLNWAEYISWRNPRMMSFDQYLLADPQPTGGSEYTGWSSGLLNPNGTQKITYGAWQMPLYLPVTKTKHGGKLEVWGCVRPERYALLDTHQTQTAQLEFAAGSSGDFTVIRSIKFTNPNNCYFDVRIPFRQSGQLRLDYPFPGDDRRLAVGVEAQSRVINVTVTH